MMKIKITGFDPEYDFNVFALLEEETGDNKKIVVTTDGSGQRSPISDKEITQSQHLLVYMTIKFFREHAKEVEVEFDQFKEAIYHLGLKKDYAIEELNDLKSRLAALMAASLKVSRVNELFKSNKEDD